ncbi:MAG: hypothetical protein DRJ03_12035 [Chloroflexi bacterium]|nr:MAG: hypothetical protein DRJ03_12035 [Chloroflexota bacterium]
MRVRVDFNSRTTGRTYLKTMFDTPQEGFTAALSLKIRHKLVRMARELENTISEDVGKTINVRLTMDSYETCVFWYIVMFRPLQVARDNVLGEKSWSVYELMHDRTRQHVLKRLDWGVFWDDENNWLVLLWEEALTGVLEKMRGCPSWDAIVTKEEKRLGHRLDWTWWKKCADSSSAVIPTWKLQDMSYMRGQLWHRPCIKYSDVTVLDASGIDIPQFQVGQEVAAVLPVAKRAHFAHHYVEEEDKRTYMASIVQFEKKDVKDKNKSRKKTGMYDTFTDTQRNERRRTNRKLCRETPQGQLARALTQISTALGKPYRKGRPPSSVSPAECERRFEYTVDAFINGDLIDPKWNRVELLLNEIEELVKSNFDIPSLGIAKRWLLWRRQGNPGIMAYFEQRSGAYSRVQKAPRNSVTRATTATRCVGGTITY